MMSGCCSIDGCTVLISLPPPPFLSAGRKRWRAYAALSTTRLLATMTAGIYAATELFGAELLVERGQETREMVHFLRTVHHQVAGVIRRHAEDSRRQRPDGEIHQARRAAHRYVRPAQPEPRPHSAAVAGHTNVVDEPAGVHRNVAGAHARTHGNRRLVGCGQAERGGRNELDRRAQHRRA